MTNHAQKMGDPISQKRLLQNLVTVYIYLFDQNRMCNLATPDEISEKEKAVFRSACQITHFPTFPIDRNEKEGNWYLLTYLLMF